MKELRVPADRGLVLDRNRKVLVDSRPSYDVVLIPYFCGKGCDEVVSRLATLLSFSFDEEQRVREHLRTARGLLRFRPFTVKVDISRDELDVIEANRIELSGAVDVLPTPHRSYRHGVWASHLLGYMNEVGPEELGKLNAEIEKAGGDVQPYQARDFVGRRGLEKRYERELRGVDGIAAGGGRRARQRQAGERPHPRGRSASSPPSRATTWCSPSTGGCRSSPRRPSRPRAGAVIAMDARTGFILALVDRPAVDPNKLAGRITRAELAEIRADPLQPELFRAIQQHYHPGSTFKVVTALAALEEGALRPGGTVYCPGRYTLGGHTLALRQGQRPRPGRPGARASGPAATSSSTRWAIAWAPTRSPSGASLLGLGKPTGLDLQGEIPGRHARRGLARRAPARRAPARHVAQHLHRPGGRQRHAAAAGGPLRGPRHRQGLAAPGGPAHRGPQGRRDEGVRARGAAARSR